jgi:hypothetical protein
MTGAVRGCVTNDVVRIDVDRGCVDDNDVVDIDDAGDDDAVAGTPKLAPPALPKLLPLLLGVISLLNDGWLVELNELIDDRPPCECAMLGVVWSPSECCDGYDDVYDV